MSIKQRWRQCASQRGQAGPHENSTLGLQLVQGVLSLESVAGSGKARWRGGQGKIWKALSAMLELRLCP